MVLADSPNGTVIDFRPAYDRIADLEHTYLEESVLGGIITDADASSEDLALGMDYVAGLLPTEAAFQHRSHRLIYACCLQLHSEGLKPTLQAVALRLAKDGLLEDAGGRNKLVKLLERDAFAVLNLKQNAGFLAEAYQRRRLVEGLNGINKEKDFDTALEKARKEIEQVRQMRCSPDLQARLSNQSMRKLIISILERNLGEADQREALNQLALDSRWHPKEVRELVELVDVELESVANRVERVQEIEQIESYKGRTLKLGRYLPQSYSVPMENVAQWLGVPSAALLLEMLVASASSAHPETRIVVKESMGFVEPLIIYGGLVTESGQRKSPTINAVFDAIKQMQAEEEYRFKVDSEAYERETKEWMASRPDNDSPDYQAWKDSAPTPPRPLREFYLDIATVEAIDKLKGDQSDTAFVLLKDELSGLFGSYGAYKNGKGEDREAILSGWNGRGRKKNLKGGERVSTLYDAMSIFGAIQDSKLQQMMGSFDDDQGDWGRFLWALMPLQALRLPESDTTFQLAFLKSLFERIRELKPQKYRFAFDAQRLYEEFHWNLEQRRVAHPQRGMRAAIAKMEGYCARLALTLHIIWEVEAGRVPAPYIPRERVQQAIRLTEFFLSQVTLIHSEGAAALGEGGLTHRLSAILGKLKQFGELTARQLQAAISWLRKVSPNKLRQEMMELAKLGYGTLVGQGNRLKLVLNKTADTADATVDKTADTTNMSQPLDIRGFQPESQLTVDTADSGFILSSDGEPSSETGFTTPDSYQQHQHISSLDSNQDLVSVSGADMVSTGISADVIADNPSDDSRKEDGDDPDDDPPGGSPVLSGYSPQDDGDGGFEVMDESATANTGVTEPSGNVGGVTLTAVEMAQWHDRMNACQTLDDATDFCTALDALPTEQRNQFESSIPDARWEWLFGLPEVRKAESSVSESVSEVQESPPSQPEVVNTELTLESLKALMLACDSLVQLNDLKRSHRKTIATAYRSMSEKEQAHVDALAALAVPHKVFKYLGDEIRQGTQRLIRGTLVYFDPTAQVRPNAYDVPVWAINGVSSGWNCPIHVSLSLLQEVAKALLPETQDGGQQMGLI